MRNISLTFAVFTVVAILHASSWAQVHISGALSGTLVDTTYIVDGDIYVQAGDSLTIDPGAELLFDGLYSFTISGYLYAAGDEQDSIKFLPKAGTPAWEGIEFSPSVSSSSQLDYCYLTGSNSSGIASFAPVLDVNRTTFSGNSADYGGGIFASGSEIHLAGCFFSNNEAVTGAGLYAADNALIQIDDCTFLNNIAEQHGGGIYVIYSESNISNSYFEGNRAENTVRGKGGGVSTQDASLAVDSCTFTLNYAGLSGGGIGFVSTNGSVSRSVFYTNSTANQGGAIMLKYTDAVVENCTIDENDALNVGSALFASRESSLTLRSSAVTNNLAPNAVYVDSSSNGSFSYSDFNGNEGGDFAGNIPPGVGQITGVNANGDPCDPFFNIYLPPGYVNQPLRDYHLTSTSPLIDAGDPTRPPDPDGTVADMGAFYFPQGAVPLTITLTPNNPPIQIPAGGGTFFYDLRIENGGTASVNFDVWTMVTLPNGTTAGPLVLRNDLSLPGGGMVEREGLPQSVPASAPSGQYIFHAYAGNYPGSPFASDSFTFEKLAGIEATAPGASWETFNGAPSDDNLLPIHPNPFNPTTSISYQLSALSFVRLSIYDVAGREVAELVNGWREAGTHKVVFDGSNLSAGVYFAQFRTGDFSQTRKLTLVK